MDTDSSHSQEERPLKEELAERVAERDYYRHIAEQSGRTGLRSVHQLSRIIENLHQHRKRLCAMPSTPLKSRSHNEQPPLPRRMRSFAKRLPERTTAERELFESRERYRELVDSANSVILRWNRQGTILFMNPYGLDLFGYTEQELVGKNVMDTIVPPSSQKDTDLGAIINAIFANPEDFSKMEIFAGTAVRFGSTGQIRPFATSRVNMLRSSQLAMM